MGVRARQWWQYVEHDREPMVGGRERVERRCDLQSWHLVDLDLPLFPSSDSIADKMFEGEVWTVRFLRGRCPSELDMFQRRDEVKGWEIMELRW